MRWFNALCLAAVLLACGLTMAPNIADADLWGHIQYGIDVLRTGELPRTATYTYTAEGYPWINHENLAEVLMAGVVLTLGPLGLVWGKFALSLVVVGLIYWVSRRDGVSWIASSVCILLVAANLGYQWSFRPQLATMVFFTLLIALLQFSFNGWRDQWLWTHPRQWWRRDWVPGDCQLKYSSAKFRALWLAVPLFAVWANTHGGFVAGLLIYLVYLSGRAFEAICQRGQAGLGLVRRMALMGLAASIACLLNPYGLALPKWLIFSIGHARPEISEWSSGQLFTLVGAKFWLFLLVGAVSICFSRRKMDLTHGIVLVLAAWESCIHFRNVSFIAILAGYWLAPHLDAALGRLLASHPQTQTRVTWKHCVAAASSVVLLAGALFPRLTELRVELNKFPVAAVHYLKEHRIGGRMVVSFDWAQYVVMALGTDKSVPLDRRTRVAFDGRFRTCYPQAIIDAFFDFTYDGNPNVRRNRFGGLSDSDPTRILEFRDPELVLIARQGEQTSSVMQGLGNRWTLLYQDGISQVWGIKWRFDDPRSLDYVPREARSISDQRVVGTCSWPALPTDGQRTNNQYLALQ